MTASLTGQQRLVLSDLPLDSVILPVQWGDRIKPQSIPEIKLLWALIEGALSDLEVFRFARKPAAREIYSTARAWFLEEDPTWYFAFVNVAAYLGLEASTISARIQRRYPALPQLPRPCLGRPNLASPPCYLREVVILSRGWPTIRIRLASGEEIDVPRKAIRHFSGGPIAPGSGGDLLVSARWARKHGLAGGGADKPLVSSPQPLAAGGEEGPA